MLNNTNKQQNVKNKNKLQRGSTIFYVALMAFPVIQFILFYIVVNFRSFGYAFMEITHDTALNQTIKEFSFKQFAHWFTDVADKVAFWESSKMSLLYYGVSLFVGIPLGLLFSYYIFKKMPAHGIFRVLLFAPSVLSAIVTVTMYKFFVESAIPVLLNMPDGMGLLSNPDTGMSTIIFFNVWISFGTQILMYSGAMNGIDPSITEAAKLDGANPFVEFFQIILPLIFPTIQTFLVTGVASIFINQLNLVAFKGLQAKPEFVTVGYYLFKDAQAATQARMPVLATYGVCLTVIAVPLTLLTRGALEKFGPSVD